MINIFLLLAMCPVPIKMRLDLDFELNEGPVSSWIPQVCHLCEPRYCLLPPMMNQIFANMVKQADWRFCESWLPQHFWFHLDARIGQVIYQGPTEGWWKLWKIWKMRNIIKNQKYLESDGSVMVSPLKNITRNNKWVSPLALVEVTIDRDISLVIIQISRGAQKKK